MARILTIAGSDSGGGAGIQADIKTITLLGGHAMTAITAVTAQNTLTVDAVHPIPCAMVLAQIDIVLNDIGADAIKIGMIGSAATAEALAQRLAGLSLPIVFDPVMIATSGAALADAETIAAFGGLLRLATVATPNLSELAMLGGAAAVRKMGCALLVKGGHASGDVLCDRLMIASEHGGEEEIIWRGTRIDSVHSHGTGCCLASAIATGLGQGLVLVAAISRARAFVRQALHLAPGLGGGCGPMGYQPLPKNLTMDIASGLTADSATQNDEAQNP